MVWAKHTDLFLANCGSTLSEFEQENERYKIQKREDYILYPPVLNARLSQGEKRFREFHWLLENAFWTPEYFQQGFLQLALQVEQKA